jgi:hypothetical protein
MDRKGILGRPSLPGEPIEPKDEDFPSSLIRDLLASESRKGRSRRRLEEAEEKRPGEAGKGWFERLGEVAGGNCKGSEETREKLLEKLRSRSDAGDPILISRAKMRGLPPTPSGLPIPSLRVRGLTLPVHCDLGGCGSILSGSACATICTSSAAKTNGTTMGTCSAITVISVGCHINSGGMASATLCSW